MEDFISQNPFLMKVDLNFLLMLLTAPIFIPGALFLIFGKLKKIPEVSWATISGKCFRLSWVAALIMWFNLAYSSWHHPGRTHLTFWETFFAGLWISLFSISMILSFRDIKQRHQTQTRGK
jgi:hypothetical protein